MPERKMVFEYLAERGLMTVGVGKIGDIYAQKGLQRFVGHACFLIEKAGDAALVKTDGLELRLQRSYIAAVIAHGEHVLRRSGQRVSNAA